MTPDFYDWHRLFGLTLTDVFQDTPWRVELEKDLAMQRQLLDVVIIEQTAPGGAAVDLPDGLDTLRAHNLLTYKSKQEALDGWALDELIGHYVNYRKLISPKQRLLPESDFQLYAVATRHPQGLMSGHPLQLTAQPGVYDLRWGTPIIRLIVLNTIKQHPRNAFWELFSTRQDRIRYGVQNYRPRRAKAWDLLYQLYLVHVLEDPNMAYTIEDFIRETRQQFLQNLPPEERWALLNLLSPEERRALLGQLPPEERRALLGQLPPEERRALLNLLPLEERQALLNLLPPEEVFKHFTPEERLRGLKPEERLRGLSPEELRQLQDYLKTLH